MRHAIGGALAAFVDFLTIHHNRWRRFDADSDTITLYRDYSEANSAIDHDFFARSTCQD
jgi:hypothetical protein